MIKIEVDADIGQRALGLLQSAQRPSVQSILIALLNELTTLQEDIICILDVSPVAIVLPP